MHEFSGMLQAITVPLSHLRRQTIENEHINVRRVSPKKLSHIISHECSKK
jgi:hypothetical protein